MSDMSADERLEGLRSEAWQRYLKARGATSQALWQGRYDALSEVRSILQATQAETGDAIASDEVRKVTENDSEFLMRTLTPEQWKVIGRKVAAETEDARRKGYNAGEIDGSKHVIKEIHAAIEHLNPPDTGMGVYELVTWALARATKNQADGDGECQGKDS